jgi:hypothetical protein
MLHRQAMDNGLHGPAISSLQESDVSQICLEINRRLLTLALLYFQLQRAARTYATLLRFREASPCIRLARGGLFAHILRRTSNILWRPA